MEKLVKNWKRLAVFFAVIISLGTYNQASAFSCGVDTVSYGGQNYNTVQIGTQCWFRENLNVGTMLASGATMPSDPAPTANDPATVQKWCYGNSTSNCNTYGGMYSWAEANRLSSSCNTTSCSVPSPNQGICPSGWHIPSDDDHKVLEMFLGMTQAQADTSGTFRGTNQGSQMSSSVTGGTNSSGFSGLLAGINLNDGSYYYGSTYGYWWTTPDASATNAWYRSLNSAQTGVFRGNNGAKTYGLSVRCLRDPVVVVAPTVTTSSASSITQSQATVSGNVTDTGEDSPSRYVEYGAISGNYTGSCSAGIGGIGSYSCNLNSLTPNTTYYYRAKATNSAGTSYGSELSFTTTIATATVTTQSASNVTAASATGNGNITDTGGENPTRYIEWGIASGNYSTGSCSASTGSTGAYSCLITGLNPSTTYYVRAKATNSGGTTYGSETSFVTPSLPVITISNPNTNPAQSKTITASADKGTLSQSITTGSTCDGTLTFSAYQSTTFSSESDNGKKVCYRSVDAGSGTSYLMSNALSGIDTTNPSVSASNSSANWQSVNPTINLATLDNNSLNYSRYIWDTSDSDCRSNGTSFTNGAVINIPSQGSHTLYLCNADTATNIGSWSGTYKLDSVAPTISGVTSDCRNTTDPEFIIAATDSLSGLDDNPYSFDGGNTWQSGNSKFYQDTAHTISANSIKVKDKAGNVATYASSASQSCIQAPSLAIDAVTSILRSSAVANGSVTGTGGENVSVNFEWGTVTGTYTHSCNAGTGGTGAYSCSLTGLSPNTTYYVRMTATNSSGTVSDGEVSFVTSNVAATLSTQDATSIEAITAIGNATILDIGNDNPERQIEWGTISGSYSGSCSAGVGGAGAYSCSMAGLNPETTYYFRAKATNSAGTSYGDEKSFVTAPSQITISNPDSTKMGDAVSSNYVTLDSGSITATSLVTTNTQLKIQDSIFNVILPVNTQITKTDSGNFNFQSLTAQNVSASVRQTFASSVAAIKFGVPNIRLSFSQPITISIDVDPSYNNQSMYVFYQNEGESEWHSQTSCLITNGKCTFTTTHATTYTVNGDGRMAGETGINLNTDVQEIISLDCGGATLNLQNLTPGTPVTGTSICTATTNANGGYSLSVKRDSATSTLSKDSERTTTIPDKADWDPTANANSGNADIWSGIGLGFTIFDSTATKNTSWWGSGTTVNDSNNKYAGFSPNQTDIMNHNSYSGTSTATSIGYKLDVSPSQKSGAYSGNITYQVVTRP